MVFITLPECPCWTVVQETARFKELSRSSDFCYHKFKNVSKAGVSASVSEINLFKALLILALTPRSCL